MFPRAAVKRVFKIAAGIFLLTGGILWFLPVLGFWMLPLGLGILGSEIPAVKAFNTCVKRRIVARFRRWKPGTLK